MDQVFVAIDAFRFAEVIGPAGVFDVAAITDEILEINRLPFTTLEAVGTYSEIGAIFAPVLIMEQLDDFQFPRGEFKVFELEFAFFDSFNPALEALPPGGADVWLHLPHALVVQIAGVQIMPIRISRATGISVGRTHPTEVGQFLGTDVRVAIFLGSDIIGEGIDERPWRIDAIMPCAMPPGGPG